MSHKIAEHSDGEREARSRAAPKRVVLSVHIVRKHLKRTAQHKNTAPELAGNMPATSAGDV